MSKRYRVFFSGTVQGVGFRFTARSLAFRYGLKGWAKNLADGRVEIEIQGPPLTLDEFLSNLKEEFKSYVSNVEKEELEPTEYKDFGIRF